MRDGRLGAVQEYDGTYASVNWSATPYATTQYAYNTLDSLTDVWDAANNQTHMNYDPLGRKTSMSDPDMGAWGYTYDLAGNLKTQTDAKSQILWFGYDELNRLIQKRQGGSGGTVLASYNYDEPGHNAGIGRHTSMSDASGSASWTYDLRGRMTNESKYIAGAGTFNTAYAYDAMDRVTSMTYPGGNAGEAGEVVTQTYNAASQLSQVRSATNNLNYASGLTYNAMGQVTAMPLNNNSLTTNYTYDPLNARLKRIQTGGLLDLGYRYDAVGNVQAITDTTNGGQVQTFGYDALDRLMSASTTSAGNGQYSESFQYNPIGNITSTTRIGNYTYPPSGPNSVRPHAATAAGSNAYTYDANGNMILRVELSGTQRITYTQAWDVENRLSTVAANGQTTTFVYDGDGKRVLRVNPDGSRTAYVGNYFEAELRGPNAPNGLSAAAASASQINLAWTDNSNNESGFKIERSPNGSSWTEIATVGANATGYQNTGLTCGTTYYYRVRAYNAAGDSGYSNTASATTSACPTLPNAPSNLSAAAVSASQINLAWTDNSNNESGFKIERSPNGSSWSEIATAGANTISYADAGLACNTAYYYRVRAYNSVGDSSYSNTANSTTWACPTLPTAPSNLRATSPAQGQANLSWTDNSTNEDGFKIERKGNLSPEDEWFEIATVGTNVTSYSDSGLCGVAAYRANETTSPSALVAAPGTFYYYSYRVRAYNASGQSDYSNVATVKVSCPYSLFNYRSQSQATLSGSAPQMLDAPLSGQTYRSYYYAGSTRIAMREQTSTQNDVYYLHADHLGSASLTTDASGNKFSEERYYPYGETRYGSSPTDYQFTGQRRENGLGSLYDFGARAYSPALGRFLSADTLVPSPGNPQSLNRYSYTLGNPLKYVDPTGHVQACADGDIGGGCGSNGTWAPPPPQDPLKQVLKQVDEWAWDNVPSTIGLHWKVASVGLDTFFGANGYPADFALVANWRSGEVGLLHTSGVEARLGTPNLVTLQTEGGVVAYNGASKIKYVGGPSVYAGAQLSADAWGNAGVSTTGCAIGMDSNIETLRLSQLKRGEYYSNFFVDPESGRFVTGGAFNGVLGVNAIANGVDFSGNAGAGFTHVLATAKFSDVARYAFPTSYPIALGLQVMLWGNRN